MTAPPSFQALLWDLHARVLQDPELGPTFVKALGTFPAGSWPVHIARLDSFWRTILHGTGQYRGDPAAHLGRGIGADQFQRWLTLRDATLHDHLPHQDATRMLVTAQRKARSLQRVIHQEVTP